MIAVYENGILVTAEGVKHHSLVINTRTGRILGPEKAHLAKKRVDASDLVFYPGLINAHEHLEFNHYPRTRWRERYENASQWAADMQSRLEAGLYAELRSLPLHVRCEVGAQKNLRAGVTTVVHHNAPHPLLRRRGFPLRVVFPYQWAHSLYLTAPAEIQKAHKKTWRGGKFFIHLAEGTDSAANAELNQLERLACLSHKTILIHGVGLRDENQGRAIQKSGGLVWCPSSNDFLLGQTAQIRPWLAAGKLMLGSDSRLTADGDILDELRAAHRSGQASYEELFHLVTSAPARLLGLHGLGDLRAGYRADIICLKRPDHADYYRALVEAKAPSGVMQKGKWVSLQLSEMVGLEKR